MKKKKFLKRQKPRGKECEEATLKFHSLFGWQSRKGFPWLYSYYQGLLVRPDPELAQLLESRLGLEDLPLASVRVRLEERWDKKNHWKFFLASTRKGKLSVVLPERKFEDSQGSLAVIDGSNFFITLEKLQSLGIALSPSRAIQLTLQGLQETPIKLVMREGDEAIFTAGLQAVKSAFNGQLQVVSMPLATGVWKVDDREVRRIIYEEIKQNNGSQLLVVFSGDKHVVWPLKKWLESPIAKDTQRPIPRQLVVVSSQMRTEGSGRHGFVSPCLLELTNDRNATFLPLEKMAGMR